MFNYFAYGLYIQSTLPIPEFIAINETNCDVSIRIDEKHELTVRGHGQYGLKVTPKEAIIFDRDVGTFLIRDGREVIIVPAIKAQENQIRLYLVGTVMAIVLYQRGLLALHASAVIVNDAAIAFMGESGWGKSSIAAALDSRGHRLINDDVTPVTLDTGLPLVFPGFPQLKLSQETATTLGYDYQSLSLLHPKLDKRAYRNTKNFPQTPFPLKCIYILVKDITQKIEPLSSQEKVIQILRHSVPTRWSQPQEKFHFFQCAQLAQNISIYYLKRSNHISCLPDLARLVEAHIEQNYLSATKAKHEN